jgi:hypothetical protein
MFILAVVKGRILAEEICKQGAEKGIRTKSDETG